MQQTKSFVLALALFAALPFAADAQSGGRNSPPGQKCRAEGGTSNSRACRERYGSRNDRVADRDDRDTDRRRRNTSNGSLCLDRDRDGYCEGRTGSEANTCRDSDRDGICDWRENGASTTTGRCADLDADGICDSRDACIDRNRDGRCDGTSSGSTTGNDGRWWEIMSGRPAGSLPLMVVAQRFANGERPSTVRTWLGTNDVRVRSYDRNRDGRAESVTWLDRSGQVLQVWQGVNADGRADRVSVYQGGKVTRVVQN